MQRLILLRHAKAERNAPSGEDFDRSLTARGRTDAALMGRVLAQAGVRPDLALVSDAQRTRDTWEEASKALGPIETRFEAALYHASSRALRATIEPYEESGRSLILVGHNPGLHQLVIDLLIEGAAAPSTLARASSKFPTASAAVFVMDAAGRAVFDGLFFAADHGGGGSE
jgi:phosphohistidine phosphatase